MLTFPHTISPKCYERWHLNKFESPLFYCCCKKEKKNPVHLLIQSKNFAQPASFVSVSEWWQCSYFIRFDSSFFLFCFFKENNQALKMRLLLLRRHSPIKKFVWRKSTALRAFGCSTPPPPKRPSHVCSTLWFLLFLLRAPSSCHQSTPSCVFVLIRPGWMKRIVSGMLSISAIKHIQMACECVCACARAHGPSYTLATSWLDDFFDNHAKRISALSQILDFSVLVFFLAIRITRTKSVRWFFKKKYQFPVARYFCFWFL